MQLDVERLLTIDVDSEIRKLAEAELGGTWQVPSELVRRSLRRGASTVRVELQRRSVSVRDDGEGLTATTLDALRLLLDPAAPRGDRHRALLELEADGEVGLIALATIAAKGLRILSAGVEVLRRGTPREDGAHDRYGVTIELDGVELDAGRARSWLETAVRFAPQPVLIGGVEVPRGAVDSIVEQPLVRPLEGVVALPRNPSAARVWLLRWGVVTTHTALPGSFAAEAAVELSGRAERHVTSGELRHAFKVELDEVKAQAVELALSTAEQLGSFSQPDQQRLRMLLLGHAALAKSASVRRVKMLPALHGLAHELEWLSIDQLVRHATGKAALAVDSAKGATWAVTHQPVFVLSSEERARLSQLYHLAFAPPPGQPSAGRLSLRGLGDGAQRFTRTLLSGLFARWRPVVPQESLTEVERQALAVFRAAATASGKRPAFTQVEVCRGSGPAYLLPRSKRLRLPRGNREVIDAMQVVARDPTWAWPALIGLLGGAAMPPAAARDSWVR